MTAEVANGNVDNILYSNGGVKSQNPKSATAGTKNRARVSGVGGVGSRRRIKHQTPPPEARAMPLLRTERKVSRKTPILRRFFSPTINYLTSMEHNIYILCISTGDADGMGDVRKQELYLASAVLKVPLNQVKIMDHPELQDGFGKVWNCDLLSRIIEEEILTNAIDLIITFDNYGVSGHCNHCDVNRGVRRLLHTTSQRNIEAWELVCHSTLSILCFLQ